MISVSQCIAYLASFNIHAISHILTLHRHSGSARAVHEDNVPFHIKRQRRCNWIIPSFEMTREVKIVEVGEQSFVTCSCDTFTGMAVACRHIFKVFDRQPVCSDTKVRFWKVYATGYGRPGKEEFTQDLLEIRDSCMMRTGVPVVGSPVLTQDNSGDRSKDFFLEALNTVKMRGNNHWSEWMSGKPQHRDYQTMDWSVTPMTGMTQEVHLSQAAAHNDDHLPLPDDDTMADESNGSDNTLEQEELKKLLEQEELKKMLKHGAYNALSANFSELCKQITTTENLKVAIEALNELHLKLLTRNNNRCNSDSNQITNMDTSMVSLPSIDRVRDTSRMRKVTSPQKKKRKNSRRRRESGKK